MIFKTWLNDLSMVSKATEGINMSMMAVGTADYSKAIDGLSLSQAKLLLNMQGVDAEQQKSLLLQAGLISSSEKMTASHVAQALSNTTLKNTEQERVLIKAGLMNAQTKELILENNCTEAKLREALATTTLDATEKDAIVTRILGANANGGYAISFDVLTASIWANIKAMAKWLVTNPVGWCILAVGAIAGVSKIIDELVVTEEELNEQLDELNSKWEELSSTIQNSSKSFQSLKSQADELIPRYAELAQGVDKYGKNVSLTDEEFSEFVSLNNQLGQMFPELVMGYDSNGNAILALSGNVDTLTESLYAFVEAQRIASAQTIADTMPEVMSNIDSTVEAYEAKIQNVEDERQALEDLYNTFKNDGFVEEWSSVGESMVSAVKILDKYGIDYSSEITGERNGVVGSTRYKITVDWDDFETAYNGRIAGFEKEVDDLIGRIEAKWKQLNPVVSAWLSTDFLYQDLDMSGQSLVTAMVGEIDFKSLGLKTEEEIQNYITNSIITPIYDMDTKTQQAFFEVFDLHEALNKGELSVQEYQDKINAILENGTYSQEFTTIFKLAFAEGDLQEEYDKAIAKFGEDNKDTLAKFFTDNSINTTEEIEYWNKVTDGAQSATEAVEMYNKVKSETFSDEITDLSITDTVNEINTKLKPALDSLKNSYTTLFTEDGYKWKPISIEEFASIESELSSLKEKFDIDIPTENYERFVEVLNDSSTTGEQAQQAFNELATTIINSSKAVRLTDENFNVFKNSLEELGITNAEEVLSELKDVQQKLADQGIDLYNSSLEEAAGFIAVAESSSIATHYLQVYHLEKALANNPLNTFADIEALEQVCSALGITGEYWDALIKLKSLYFSLENGGDEQFGTELQADIQQAKADLDAIYNDQYKYTVDLEFGGIVDSSKSGSGSKSEYDWKNLLDKEIAVLEKQLEAGLIDFDTYLGKRLDLIEKYYQEGKIKAEDYYEYLEKTYENQLSIYDRVISAVTNKLEKQIEQLEKQKEAIEEGYQLQIDKLTEEIELLEKEYQKKKDLEELEQARYNAEKARNQRTKKLYTGDNFTYVADDEAVRDAEEELADKELQMNISRLEEQIESLEKEMEEATKLIDEQIEKLQEYIEQWNDVADTYEEAQNEMLASQVLGAQWEAEILALRQDILEQFKNEYVRIQEEMANAALKAAEAQLEAEKLLANGSGSGNGGGSGGAGGSGGSNPSVQDKSKDESEDKTPEWEYRGKKYKSLESAEEAARAYALDFVNNHTGMNASDRRAALEYYTNKEIGNIIKCAKGGVIKKSDNIFSPIAESIGEDTMIAVRDGERVLTPIQNKHFEKLISISDKLVPALLKGNLLNNNLFSNLQNNNMPYVPPTTTANSINISIGDINLHEVNDVNTLSQAIISQLPNKISQAINRR